MTIPIDVLKHFTIENYWNSSTGIRDHIYSELRCSEPLHGSILLAIGADLDQIVNIALEHWTIHEAE